jgi:hypothetical protein
MKWMNTIVLAGALAAVITLPASARVTSADCSALAAKVSAAVRAHSDSPNITAAKGEQMSGAYYCGLGSYAKGVEHFNNALTLLDVQ